MIKKRIIKLLSLTVFHCVLITMPGQANIVNSQKTPTTTENPRSVILFDNDWRFHRGAAQSAEFVHFDDSQWRKVDLPHDWSIEDLPGKNSPFDPGAVSQVSGGFTVGGTSWYRKSFDIPLEHRNKKISILFEGIYMNAECWLNGELLGNHPYGYTSFWYDISDKVKFGENNVLAVKVMNEGQNSRWYSGSGIYRHVWLSLTNPVHIAQWGVNITTPSVNNKQATVNVKTTIENSSEKRQTVNLINRIINSKGQEVSVTESNKSIDAKGNLEFDKDIQIKNPDLWSIESPLLYIAVNEIYIDGKLVDKKENTFGVRSISFDTENGFQLNGKTLKLKGGCVHHDNGPLGARAYDRAEERRVELLKASGYNAIRSSHNPPSPAFLDACDRLGMLVIDESFDMWRIANNPHDYHLYFDEWWQRDIESMVYRDRNHPSVIMWSIGNEIREMESPAVIAVSKMLGDYVRKLDPTRPVIAAVNALRPEKDPFFATLDVGGYNYATGGDHLKESIYSIDHLRVPDRIMMGTESYPLEAFQAWMDVIDNDFLIGDFVWTSFDYIGEASIGWRGYWQESNFYPWNLAYCGDLDICGWKRPQSFYRDALWKENQVSVFVKPQSPTFPENPNRQFWSKWHWHDVVADWNWTGFEDKPMEVTAYSSCETTELFLNGKSLGKKKTDRSTEFFATWEVPYAPGELKVVGYKGKKAVASNILKTSGETSSINIIPDRREILSNNQDLSYVTIELTDKDGNRNPKDNRLLSFEIEGEGTIVGVGNANPMSVESCQLPQRNAWQGKCLVVIKSTDKPGPIKLKVKANQLSTTETIIITKQSLF